MDGFEEDELEAGAVVPPTEDGEDGEPIDPPAGTLAEEDEVEEDENALPLGMTEVDEEL